MLNKIVKRLNLNIVIHVSTNDYKINISRLYNRIIQINESYNFFEIKLITIKKIEMLVFIIYDSIYKLHLTPSVALNTL